MTSGHRRKENPLALYCEPVRHYTRLRASSEPIPAGLLAAFRNVNAIFCAQVPIPCVPSAAKGRQVLPLLPRRTLYQDAKALFHTQRRRSWYGSQSHIYHLRTRGRNTVLCILHLHVSHKTVFEDILCRAIDIPLANHLERLQFQIHKNRRGHANVSSFDRSKLLLSSCSSRCSGSPTSARSEVSCRVGAVTTENVNEHAHQAVRSATPAPIHGTFNLRRRRRCGSSAALGQVLDLAGQLPQPLGTSRRRHGFTCSRVCCA